MKGAALVPDEMTYSAGFASGVAEEMATNPDIFVIGTDLVHRGGHWAQIKGLVDVVGPGRVFDRRSPRRPWSPRESVPPWPVCTRSST